MQPEVKIGGGVGVLLKYANRHGLIAGATGTGKTVTLQTLAEGFSRNGVPVFVADVKGDLSGISAPGGGNAKVEQRAQQLGIAPLEYAGTPAIFWDLFGEQGHPIRATVSDMGPLILSRLLSLNPTQEGVLNVAFQLADDQGMLLLDLKDLRSMLTFVAENAADLRTTYGNVSSASVGAIQRQLLILEQQQGEQFFGEPALELPDLMRTSLDGKGYVSVLAANKLIQSPNLYATFLLWLMAELFEDLPEVGDLPKPKLVFFFDEAHLLFDDAPKALIDKVEQVVRLIRSKGVGLYFVTQSPTDIPEEVLGQLGNRVQHALRAFSPKDQKAVQVAADTFRENPAFDTREAITSLGVGEALVSVLDESGIPTLVERVLVVPPVSRLGPITDAERQQAIHTSPVQGKYEHGIDRESAYELLTARAEAQQREIEAQEARLELERAEKEQAKLEKAQLDLIRKQARMRQSPARQSAPRRTSGIPSMDKIAGGVIRSAGSQIGRQIGRELMRGILGSLRRR